MQRNPDLSIYNIKEFIDFDNFCICSDGSNLIKVQCINNLIVQHVFELEGIENIYKYLDNIVIYTIDYLYIFDSDFNEICKLPISNFHLYFKYHFVKDFLLFSFIEKGNNKSKWLLIDFLSKKIDRKIELPNGSTLYHINPVQNVLYYQNRNNFYCYNYNDNIEVWVLDVRAIDPISSFAFYRNIYSDDEIVILHNQSTYITLCICLDKGGLICSFTNYDYVEKAGNNSLIFFKDRSIFLFDIEKKLMRMLSEIKEDSFSFTVLNPKIIQQKYIMLSNINSSVNFIELETGNLKYQFINNYLKKNGGSGVVYRLINDNCLIFSKSFEGHREVHFYIIDELISDEKGQ